MGSVNTLLEALPEAAFRETHRRHSSRSAEAAYDRLINTRWRDLKLTSFLMAIRGFWARRQRGLTLSELLDEKWINPESIFTPLLMQPGRYLAVGFIAIPWNLTSDQPPIQPATLTELESAKAVGGMKIGMDFVFTASAAGCHITTTTLCEASSAAAARKFRPYWLLIRPFSGLIRREILWRISR